MNDSNPALIEFEQGLRHCDQQMHTYHAVLQAFCEQYADSVLFDHSAPDQAIIHELHSLKGLSATIGAQPLSSAAATLFHNWTTLDKSKRINHLVDLQVHINAVIKQVNHYLTQNC
tara:strand:+ start:4074 stop:4421 length:348 start_codon:yes stop_codon:yes gene_type:complete